MKMDTAGHPGLHPFVQACVDGLEFAAPRLKTLMEGLTPEQLVKTPEGFANSIATLVVHIYGLEARMGHLLAGETMSDDLKAEFLLHLPRSPLPAATGETAESLIAKQNKGRSILMKGLGQITEADLDKELPMGPERMATVRWILTLLSAHQSIHAGQILLLKKLV